MIQAHYWTGYMTLWLKAEHWPVTLINILPTFINLLQALSSWLGTTLAATVSLRGLWTFQAVRQWPTAGADPRCSWSLPRSA